MASIRTVSVAGSKGWVRLTRLIALFLLAYSFADVLCPEYCCEEMIGLYGPSAIIAFDAGSVSNSLAAVEPGNPQQGQDSGAIPGDEDCFCRSSVLPSPGGQSASMERHIAAVPASVPSYTVPRTAPLIDGHLTFRSPIGPSAPPLLLKMSFRC
jgi:hypothetical protein